MTALDAATGARLWQRTPSGNYGSPVTVAGGLVFRAGYDNAVARDVATGADVWLASGFEGIGDERISAFDGTLMWVGSRAYDLRSGLIRSISEHRGPIALSAPLGYQVRGNRA